VLEKAEAPWQENLDLGGGRCNFTNLHCRAENFFPAILTLPSRCWRGTRRRTSSRWWRNIASPITKKPSDNCFGDGSAQQILDMLETECRATGARMFTKTAIQEVLRAGNFVVRTQDAEFQAPVLVVATGGLSIPKMGRHRLATTWRKNLG